jgi:hypothetical protein
MTESNGTIMAGTVGVRSFPAHHTRLILYCCVFDYNLNHMTLTVITLSVDIIKV